MRPDTLNPDLNDLLERGRRVRDELFAGNESEMARELGIDQSNVHRALNPKPKNRESTIRRRLLDLGLALTRHGAINREWWETGDGRMRIEVTGDFAPEPPSDVSRLDPPVELPDPIDPLDPTAITRALMRIGAQAGALADEFSEPYALRIFPNTAAAAGNGCVIFEPEYGIEITVPKHFIRAIVGFNPPDAMVSIFVRGRSMLPTFPEGSMLFVDPNDLGDSGPGRYVLMKNDTPPELLTKKVSPMVSGGFVLVSDNQLEGYPNEIYRPASDDEHEADARMLVNVHTGDVVDLRIAGRVLWPKSLPDMARVEEIALLFRSFFRGGGDGARGEVPGL